MIASRGRPARPRARWVAATALAALAIAVGPASAAAQVTAAPDTVARDTLATDTLPPRPPAPDTIKAPLARAELPVTPTIGDAYHWDRDALFASGAQSLLELLDLVPGATTFRSGWLASVKTGSYLGDAARVRVFVDGLEITSLNPRTGGVLDLSDIQLWMFEEVRIERGADELRVHARTWRVDRTAPSTRTDVATGDQNTNIFRGFFGKRFRHGESLQLAAQQYGVGGTLAGDGDELAAMGRVGWAGGGWSVDAFGARSSLNRDNRSRIGVGGSLPQLEARRTDAYLRVARGDPEDGFWAQALGAIHHFRETSDRLVGTDTVDTARTTRQYVAALGFTRWGARFSLTNRLDREAGDWRNAVTGRASLSRGPVALTLFTEQRGSHAPSVEEASVVFQPFSFFAVSGAVSRRHADGADDRIAARGEVGVRIARAWASAGVLRSDGFVTPGLVAFDPTYAAVDIPSATGVFGTVRGRVYRDLGLDVWLVRWSDSTFYRPRMQGRGELYLDTRWLSRFPRRNFGFLGSVAYEYRSASFFPSVTGASLDIRRVATQHIGHVQVEIRLIDAVLFYQQRFGLYPRNGEIVPGHPFPAQLQLYGVRWQFWN